jgi:hypothetical protein
MAAGWFSEKNWESGGCETGAFKEKRISTSSRFEREEDFYMDEFNCNK